MSKIWMAANIHSGSYDKTLCQSVSGALSAEGHDMARMIECPHEALPTAAELTAAGVDALAVFGGDGTVNGALRSAQGWNGHMLALPGGTMNLLARTLHGDADSETIARRYAQGRSRISPIPVVIGEGETALVGVIAGPTTAWGEVREDMRHFNLADMPGSIADAWTKTFGGAQVRLDGDGAAYPALFIEPAHHALRVTGFTAEGAGQLFAHGLSWLKGDFREGPHETLGARAALSLSADDGKPVGLLVDGEESAGSAICHFRHGLSAVDFVYTMQESPANDVS